MYRNAILVLTLLAAATQLPSQQPAAGAPDFHKDIQPIFNQNCVDCHSGSSASAGLQLDSAQGVLAGGASGKAIVPGNSKESLLVQKITEKSMPPGGPLSDQQIALIAAWVDQGAKTGEDAARKGPGARGQGSGQAPQPPRAPISVIASAAQERALINQYCVVCHSDKLKTGGLTLQAVDTGNVEKDAETWERVVHMLRAGMMPKAGMPRPDRTTYEAMIVYLENELDRHPPTSLPPPGLHRLNRTEYANAIHDLLGVEIDPAKFLPSDDSTRGFDNIAGALSLSPALLEGYTSAAGKISRLAVGDVTAPTEATYRVPEDTTQDYHIDGMPFGTRGGMLVKNDFPADGEYSIKISPISKGNMGNNNPFGEIPGEKLELLLDGQRVKLFDWDRDRERADGTFNFKFAAKGGLHTVVVTFLATNYAPGDDLDEHFLRSTIETGGL